MATPTPKKRILGELIPFAHKWRANKNPPLPLGIRPQHKPQALHPARHIGRQHNDSRIRECCGDLFRNALHTRTAGDEMIERAAFRAGFRHRFVIAALMAHQLFAKTMLHQPA